MFDDYYPVIVTGYAALVLVYVGAWIGIGLTALVVYRRRVNRWLAGGGASGRWQVQLIAPDGDIIRSECLPAEGVSTLVGDLNARRFA